MFKPNEGWSFAEKPIAYLLTFGVYGSWLHGNARGSIQRGHGDSPPRQLVPSAPLEETMRGQLKRPTCRFDRLQRKVIEEAITELCKSRAYTLFAINVRTNHLHAIASFDAKPERAADAMKAFATKRLREKGLVQETEKVWARGRSCRYIWKERHLSLAIEYVLYGQSDIPPEF